jgi:hypothetical protein
MLAHLIHLTVEATDGLVLIHWHKWPLYLTCQLRSSTSCWLTNRKYANRLTLNLQVFYINLGKLSLLLLLACLIWLHLALLALYNRLVKIFTLFHAIISKLLSRFLCGYNYHCLNSLQISDFTPTSDLTKCQKNYPLALRLLCINIHHIPSFQSDSLTLMCYKLHIIYIKKQFVVPNRVLSMDNYMSQLHITNLLNQVCCWVAYKSRPHRWLCFQLIFCWEQFFFSWMLKPDNSCKRHMTSAKVYRRFPHQQVVCNMF